MAEFKLNEKEIETLAKLELNIFLIHGTRNSISMAASANFSHKSLEGKSGSDKQEMLFNEKGINWNDYKTKYKRGVVIKKVADINESGEIVVVRNKWVSLETPIFTGDRDFLINLIPKL